MTHKITYLVQHKVLPAWTTIKSWRSKIEQSQSCVYYLWVPKTRRMKQHHHPRTIWSSPLLPHLTMGINSTMNLVLQWNQSRYLHQHHTMSQWKTKSDHGNWSAFQTLNCHWCYWHWQSSLLSQQDRPSFTSQQHCYGNVSLKCACLYDHVDWQVAKWYFPVIHLQASTRIQQRHEFKNAYSRQNTRDVQLFFPASWVLGFRLGLGDLTN